MPPSPNWILAVAGLSGFLGVALGAFGAHALKATLEANASLETWRTAVLYHLAHSVALLALASGRNLLAGPVTAVAWCWIAGIVFFSGSLYSLALGGPKFLGPVTPLGGLCLLAGWVVVIFSAWRQPAA